ncbi:MAG: zinc-ribbon domain-containing protein [Actinomycetaceae bacterium]
MIIWGSRTKRRHVLTANLVCSRCHNPAANHLFLLITKFTLFFIPLFPVSKKRFLECTFCGTQTALSKEQFEQLEQSAEQGGAAQGSYGGPAGSVPQGYGQAGHQQQAPGQQSYPGANYGPQAGQQHQQPGMQQYPGANYHPQG